MVCGACKFCCNSCNLFSISCFFLRRSSFSLSVSVFISILDFFVFLYALNNSFVKFLINTAFSIFFAFLPCTTSIIFSNSFLSFSRKLFTRKNCSSFIMSIHSLRLAVIENQIFLLHIFLKAKGLVLLLYFVQGVILILKTKQIFLLLWIPPLQRVLLPRQKVKQAYLFSG